MTHQGIIDYFLKKNGAYLDCSFDLVTLGNKAKAMSQKRGRESDPKSCARLSCGDAERFAQASPLEGGS